MDSNDDDSTAQIAIGASAGGIEACRALLQEVPADCRAAFIVVLHLDPTRPSSIAEILQTAAGRLTVVQANGAERLESGHVYVIAPNSKLSLAGDMLEVVALAKDEARGGLVDYLFSSVAKARGPSAVGVVLSGAGHDGTRGLEAIRKAGGLCIAQDPDSGSSSGMPQSAIDARVVDAVLTPDAIWPTVAKFIADGSRPTTQQDKREQRSDVPDAPGDSDGSADGFQRVLQAMGELANVDFDDYKTGTLARRTRRRMDLLRIDDWDEYADLLAEEREELDALYQDVLIGVTGFFRDPEVWEHLADELQGLLEQRESPGFRAWVPGCATGEEAYTLAMLAHEQLPASDVSKIRIYATDLNPDALVAARRGIYPAAALESVIARRRDQYFTQRDGQFQVARSIRDCVTFAAHNVLADPPFSNMDVVSCRNLLIYLKPQAHDRLLKCLHFALHSGGLLMLGRAERLGRQGDLFAEISKKHSLFRARRAPHAEPFQVAPRTRMRARGAGSPTPLLASGSLIGSRTPPGPDRRIEQFVLRQHTAACVVINDNGEIQHHYGRTERYLVPPTGESRQDLLAWVRQGFFVRMRSVLRRALESGEQVDTEGQIERDSAVHRVHCSISPLPAEIGAQGLFLVEFRDVSDVSRRTLDPTDSDEPVVRELEQELRDSRVELQATVEQLEAAGEEYRASHEELLSLNEELQSSNEELEASKEELEALNEEMNTINRELEQKNISFREVNSDLSNLFLSTGIPTVFLDQELNIRRFTAAATQVMRLVPSDVGRSIEYIKERYDDGSTSELCRRVLETRESAITEVRATDGRYFMRRIGPYRTEDNDIEGVCITFSDVTEQKRAVQRGELLQAFSEALIRTVRTPLLVLDEHLRIESMNDAFRSVFAVGDECLGQQLSDAWDRQWKVPNLDVLLTKVLSQGKDVNDYEVTSEERTILINARRVEHGHDSARIVLSFEDLTAHRASRQQAEQRTMELGSEAERKDRWIAMLGHELRNPVGAVSNGLELLKSGSLAADEQPQVVLMMDRQIRHVSALLDDLLDAARIIAGKLDIGYDLVDMAQVGESALDSIGHLVGELDLTTRLPPVGSVWVRGDKVRLTEVISNLLINATKFTKAPGEVRLEITADDETVSVRVCDSGIGISDDLKKHVFEMFTQGPRPLNGMTQGLGLGLPLVRTLVEAHGGEVQAFSDGDGKGSEFRVSLPRLAHQENHDGSAAEEVALERMSRRRILIVDDVHDAADSLTLLMQSGGHEVRTTYDGPSALVAVRDFKPDIALLDISLPGMDGYELARRLRDELPDATFIAVTGYRENGARLKQSGFDHHFPKPLDVQGLLSLVAGEGAGENISTG